MNPFAVSPWKRRAAALLPLVLVLGCSICSGHAGVVHVSPPADGMWIAAPGRVEPVSEEIRLSFDLPGRLKDVSVEEGDAVVVGQAVAELYNDEFRARVAQAEQAAASRSENLRKLVAGARSMERDEVKAQWAEAKAVLREAKLEHERRKHLANQGMMAREEADRAEREFRVATQRAEAARQRVLLVEDRSREEDIKAAEADLAQAKGVLAEARAMFDKTVIRSPLTGVVLRKHRRAGEMVSVSYDSPVVTVGDISALRVRADVDENDVSKVKEGQKAYMVADAYGATKFGGRVVRVAKVLGRKNVKTEAPAEKNDRKILEALIAFDKPESIPVGLRMDVFIMVGP